MPIDSEVQKGKKAVVRLSEYIWSGTRLSITPANLW